MKKMKWLCLMLCSLVLFSGCEQLNISGRETATTPSLQLLEMPPYEETGGLVSGKEQFGESAMVDLWLDASQVMGGINENPDSLYPQTHRKYRQGGFHYRIGAGSVGWYEDVLHCLVEAGGNARVRILRCGNERLPDSLLESFGFTGTEEELRSYRRDLLTYAVNPDAGIFSEFSSEKMTDSFYSLGSPQMNQMSRFFADNGTELENPGRVKEMFAVLNSVINDFHTKGTPAPAHLNATGNNADSPLLYALENLDPRRLSVITCDPATLRSLQGTTLDGSPVGFVENLLREKKLFDNGASAAVYALTLDYMGHIVSFGAADFSESLIWGTPDYYRNQETLTNALSMPRVLLMVVTGNAAQVEKYCESLNQKFAANSRLAELRGPQNGELTYKANGQTVVQQPFHFSYQYTLVNRPGFGYYSHLTEGAELMVEGGGAAREKNGLQMAEIEGTKDETLVYSWAAQELPHGVEMDLSSLSGAKLEVIDSLTLTEILPNTPETVTGEGVQVLPLRDKLYCFRQAEYPFRDGGESPFALESIALSEDGSRLVVKIKADHSGLRSGYYRLQLSADVTGEQLQWPKVDWAENGTGLSVEISSAEIVAWKALVDALSQNARQSRYIPGRFFHAWSDVDGDVYKGVKIPDFPPVYKAPNLNRLLSQIRQAANMETAPLIRCTFDVFVTQVIEP